MNWGFEGRIKRNIVEEAREKKSSGGFGALVAVIEGAKEEEAEEGHG